MERSQILKKIESIDNLPTLPSVALAVNRLLKNDDTAVEELVALLKKDQSLVMKILRLVNSSFFGFKCRVTSINHAVTLLGFSTVQNAVVTVSIIEALSINKNIDGFAIESFWEHSISVAMMCRYIAVSTKLIPPEDAFTAGLLHDIGKIIWVNYFPKLMLDILQEMQKNEIDFIASEKALGLPSHGIIGSMLAHRWMLPACMVECIKYHHLERKRKSSSYLTNIVSLSDDIYHMMNGDKNSGLALGTYSEKVRSAAIHLFKSDPDWFKKIKSEIDNACGFLKQEVA